jgi:hypothetical protein
MPDEFSAYYAGFLDGVYDCVDRIVLNAYFRLGQSAGGFRTWWRKLEGSDDNLDNAHLMRMAGRFSRRVHAHAKAHRIPIIYCGRDERKHEIAEQYLPREPGFVGVFVILVGRAQASVWDVRLSKGGKIVDIARKKPLPWVNHYSFHVMDPEWGHVTIKVCGHPPFGAQIILNGHEYVACRARQQGVQFTKDGHCFSEVSDAARLAQVADTLCSPDMIGRLSQVCERWIYSACVCFALDLAEQERTGFRYDYSVYQGEYSRNLLFTRGSEMEQVFQGVVDRTRSLLDVKTLKTIFGTKKRPLRRTGKGGSRLEVVVETPTYDLTVFKLHFGQLTAKMYTKGAHVLRIEIIVHNARALPGGHSLPKFPGIILCLKNILNRFLSVLRCVDGAFVSAASLDEWPTPSQMGQTRVGGVDINKPRTRAVVEAVIGLAAAPQGFTLSQMAAQVRANTGLAQGEYTSRQAAYDLKKLRGKDLVRKIDKSRRYETVPEGLRAMTAVLILREKVIKPVLARAGKPRRAPKPKQQSPVDAHYETIQLAMRNLFQTIGIAA